MRAVLCTAYGMPETLEMQEIDSPTIDDTENETIGAGAAATESA